MPESNSDAMVTGVPRPGMDYQSDWYGRIDIESSLSERDDHGERRELSFPVP
jgi:hypothetical protein